jgi:hypothetical protein
MYEKPLHCKLCRKWYGGTPKTKYASWCTVYAKPAVRVVNTCIDNKSKILEVGDREWSQTE